jgi:hypothetical protein
MVPLIQPVAIDPPILVHRPITGGRARWIGMMPSMTPAVHPPSHVARPASNGRWIWLQTTRPMAPMHPVSIDPPIHIDPPIPIRPLAMWAGATR